MAAAKSSSTGRRRRTAEEARAQILDAAEKRLIETGPAGIRLQEVAADLGVSHPTVLHHFGSREALVQAVAERVQKDIYRQVIDAMRETAIGEEALPELFERIFTTLTAKGQSRVWYWLALENMERPDERQPLRTVVETAQEIRKHRRAELGKSTEVSLEDTRFVVALAIMALTSQSVLGDHLLESVGLRGDEKTHARFRAWLAKILVKHLENA